MKRLSEEVANLEFGVGITWVAQPKAPEVYWRKEVPEQAASPKPLISVPNKWVVEALPET